MIRSRYDARMVTSCSRHLISINAAQSSLFHVSDAKLASSSVGPKEKAMKRFGIPAVLATAVLILPIGPSSSRADDAHHPAPTRDPAQSNAPTAQGEAHQPPTSPAPTTGQAGPRHGQMQPGQPQGGMMNCPMMDGHAQQGGMNCPMMQGQGGGHGMMPGMEQPKSNSPH
jgi:hypothetical protein